MNIKSFITDWIKTGNTYDTGRYLEFFQKNAILDDPSVGRKFNGHNGISQYFTSYFIGYKTQTRLVKLSTGENNAQLEVEFTGEFPEGKIGGTFDIIFDNEKISFIKADLLRK